MDIEEAIKILNKLKEIFSSPDPFKDDKDYDRAKAIEILLTAYEKEKEKNKKIDEFCTKELAFERRLKRENREPDEFNQVRFYVCENIMEVINNE